MPWSNAKLEQELGELREDLVFVKARLEKIAMKVEAKTVADKYPSYSMKPYSDYSYNEIEKLRDELRATKSTLESYVKSNNRYYDKLQEIKRIVNG